METIAPSMPGSVSHTQEPSPIIRKSNDSPRCAAFLALLPSRHFFAGFGGTKSAHTRPDQPESGGMELSSARALLHQRGYELVVRCGSHIHAIHVISATLQDERHLCCIDALPLLDANTFWLLVREVFGAVGRTIPSDQPWHQEGHRFTLPSREEGVHE